MPTGREGAAEPAPSATPGDPRPVVVTGAQRGIGLAIAEGFARAGHAVVIADVAVPAHDGALAARWSPLTPLGRVGTVDDVARVVLALSGETFGFVTGQTLGVDGGLFARSAWPADY